MPAFFMLSGNVKICRPVVFSKFFGYNDMEQGEGRLVCGVE